MSSFNLSERQIFILNLLLGLLVIPFLALCVNDVIKFRLATNVLPTAAELPRRAAAAPSLTRRPRTYYDTIARREIFSLAPPPEESAPVADEALQVKLVGTSEITSRRPYAIVEDPSGTQALYRVGDTIPNVGQLVDVQANRAIIFRNGRRVGLKLQLETPTPGAPFTAPVPGRAAPPLRPGGGLSRQPVGGGIHPLGTNRFLLDRSTVNSNLQNMAPLFTQIRATPNLANGTANGFKLSEIQPNSIFQQIGLHDGDLLSAVNGQGIGDPAKAMMMLQSLQNQQSITLNIVRNGKPMQLFYNIR